MHRMHQVPHFTHASFILSLPILIDKDHSKIAVSK